MQPSNPPLDEFQKRFCSDTNRNIRLLAPAGSGKTHSLLYRCAEVHRRQGGSAKFLLITFTRAARDELRKRLALPDFKEASGAIEVSTLNGWGWKRVRSVFSNPRLMTSAYDKNMLSRNVLAPVIERHPIVAEAARSGTGRFHELLLETIDLLKSLSFDHEQHVTPAAHEALMEHLEDIGCGAMLNILSDNLEKLKIIPPPAEARKSDEPHPFKKFMEFWCDAVGTLQSQAFFTLEDQKYAAARVLEAAIERKQLPVGGARYTDILVDEFQDINPLDLRLVKALVTYNNSSITIVGDDDQAIYEWRGSVPDFILNPEKNFKRDFVTHILENNYRCPANIVESSKALISNNKRRVKKVIQAKSPLTAEIEVAMQEDFTRTIEKVVGVVQGFMSQYGGKGQRIALMSRKRAQLIPYQIIFAAEGISFCAAEDLQVFLSEAFKQLRGVIEIRASCEGRMRSRQITDAVVMLVDKLKRFPLKKEERAKLEGHLTRSSPKSMEEGIASLAAYAGPIKSMTGEAAVSMCRSAAISLRKYVGSETVSACLDSLAVDFQGFEKDYGKSRDEIFYADPPFYYLSRYAERYGTDFDAFLDDIDKAIDTLVQLPIDEDSASDFWDRPVHLMTALRAKGREFDEVVLLDVNDGIWPAKQAVSEAQQEQERRVFYVAMTRVKRKLWLTVSARIGDDPTVPSPYLREARFTS
ncbi:UvrD-helicase domain-containing protein [Taklimakanibacter lacteus]|uniref:UvrD-helicase domain-containing protein n=1 Tax=Taklimakanibacter lacteus TaxID=2268456 RepID=UPI000E660F5A